MTREEAIVVLKGLMKNPLFSEVHKVAFNIAIHDIKQRHDWNINNLILINKDNYEPLEQEPRKGHWIKSRDSYGNNHFTCPFCEHDIATKADTWGDNYCSNCGADMREVEK